MNMGDLAVVEGEHASHILLLQDPSPSDDNSKVLSLLTPLTMPNHAVSLQDLKSMDACAVLANRMVDKAFMGMQHKPKV